MIKKIRRKSLKTLLVLTLFAVLVFNLSACSQSTGTNASKSSNAAADSNETTKKIVDMAGRTVTVPSKITKVYSASPVGTTFLYTLAPEKISGLNYVLSDGEKKYTTAAYQKLPVLSGNFGQGNTMNKEEILKVKPDIILNMGDLTNSTVSDCDKIQTDLGIPVVYVTGDLDKMDKAYELVGSLTGDTKKAKELGDYCKKTYDAVKATAAKIPADKKVKVYYAEGPNGLQTDPEGSTHSQLLNLVGATNIADVKVKQGYGRSEVSMEQLIKWNPEIIIVCVDQGAAAPSDNPYDKIMSDPNWSNIKAVKDKKVYVIPYLPYNWFDRPPSVMRIMGEKWLGNLLYPDYYKYDIKADTKEFYDKFFHIKITDDQYKEITANSK